MKGALHSSWIARNRDQDRSSQQYPLTPTYTSPRSAPKPPSAGLEKPHSTLRTIQSAFFRKPTQYVSSTLSLQSAHSSSSNLSESHSVHPFATMTPPPVPVVSNHDALDAEDECPVCLESLSFSFRLPGEKPHIVPECGHALHEACFVAVYGLPPNQAKGSLPRKSNLGVCGICRRPMKVGDGDGSKSNKLAALTGMGPSNGPALYPGREAPGPRQRSTATPQPFDPTADDPIDGTPSVRSANTAEQPQYIVTPSIQVRPEFPSLTRTSDASQPLTCIVVIELPGKRNSGQVPGPYMLDHYARSSSGTVQGRNASPFSPSSNTHNGHPGPNGRGHYMQSPTSESSEPLSPPTYPQSPNEASQSDHTAASDEEPSFSSESVVDELPENSPFNAITEDLRNRIIDWKGQPLSDLGPLQMYDLLSVRRDSLVREFYVYLFREAIICVVEEKKRTFGRLLSSASNATSSAFSDSTTSSGTSNQAKGVLRLKGRIYVRHIRQVTATSAAGEMSLTIDMEDDLASFILLFKDRSSMEAWKSNIQSLATMSQEQSARSRQPQPRPQAPAPDLEEFGGSAKAARILNGSPGTTVSTVDSLLNGSSRSTASSSTSNGSNASQQMHNKLAVLGEDDEVSNYDSPLNLVTPYMSSGPSNSLKPLPHPPLDLILVLSIPPPSATPSTATLKLRVIKTSLDFILASLGTKDRLSLVSYEVGVGGKVRKTPFLSIGKTQSRARLSKFVDMLGISGEGVQDEFQVRVPKEEKTDVVTAVNHGLDVVLQRKARNPVSGMILVSDAADSTRRAQMDLVLARAEAANIPIHSFGYGRSHDPASLWLMSNHTGGTYTFVKDWYDLRDCLAGCIGGMMSIGLLNMKLHMKVVDSTRFRIRKVSGGPSSILSSDGQNVDVEVGELRYGERKEMLLELELDNGDVRKAASQASQEGHAPNATDAFVHSMGLDSLSLGDADFVDGIMDYMIDEVPVVEVDGSFFDPSASKQVSRLAHPVLLTVTLLPMANTPPRNAVNPSDPVIVRRRMELLASDMITRALVLVSRKNYVQAQKIMGETKRILVTVLQTISRSLPAPSNTGSTTRNRKEILTLSAVRAMQAILQDLQILAEALEDNVEMFAHDQRNFGAQQAMILRDQKSWSGRSATERLFWTADDSIELVSRSTDWVARE